MHEQRIAHRDLKPGNIIISLQGNVKVVDFGLALTVPTDSDIRFVQDGKHCGSPHYLAPELYLPGKFNPFLAELWSLGIILYVMAAGYVPFDDKSASDLGRRILQGKYTIPSYVSEDIREVIKLLLVRNPEERLSLEKLVKHRIFESAPILILPRYTEESGSANEFGSSSSTSSTLNFSTADDSSMKD
eukprot:g61469.t1